MKMPSRSLALVAALAVVGCVTEQPPAELPDTRAEDAATIHALVKEWSAAAGAKDPDTFAKVFTSESVLMMEDAPDLKGADAVREAAAGMMQDPNFALSFSADDVVVARAGDIAYEVGTYSLTMSDADGNPADETGSYVVVWKKQADGSWKVVIDAPVSDPPAEEAAD